LTVTIRDYLKRRWGKIVLTSIGVLSVAALLAHGHLNDPVIADAYWALGIAAVAMLGWNLYRTPCPKCSKPMGGTAAWVTRGRVGDHKRCPQCRVRLDDPIPERR
jgi:hypothetical protein